MDPEPYCKLPLDEFPGYFVDSNGDVWNRHGRKLKQSIYSKMNIYLRVGPYINGKQYHRSVHVLVCEAFHGPRPTSTHQASHINGNKYDNVPDNLIWETAAENLARREQHGTLVRGSKNGNAKLTEEDVLAIRASTDLVCEIAVDYNVSPGLISHVRTRRIWKHI